MSVTDQPNKILQITPILDPETTIEMLSRTQEIVKQALKAWLTEELSNQAVIQITRKQLIDQGAITVETNPLSQEAQIAKGLILVDKTIKGLLETDAEPLKLTDEDSRELSTALIEEACEILKKYRIRKPLIYLKALLRNEIQRQRKAETLEELSPYLIEQGLTSLVQPEPAQIDPKQVVAAIEDLNLSADILRAIEEEIPQNNPEELLGFMLTLLIASGIQNPEQVLIERGILVARRSPYLKD